MSNEGDLVALIDLVGRSPDPALLGDGAQWLPPDVGRPAPIPPDPRHERIVGIGVTLTATSLIGGIVLAGLGFVLAISGQGTIAWIALALGALLAGTHWGWVHFAEVTANSIEARRNQGLIADRDAWLKSIEPYTRYTITTSVADDGGVVIERVAHVPFPVGEDRFSFTRKLELREVHSGEEPGAVVTERAENLRREAALDTGRERARYEAAASAYETARLADADEAERIAAVRAASEALSDQINANLREPPLIE